MYMGSNWAGALENQNQPRIEELHKTHVLMADIERRRLEWLGHMIRIDQTREAKEFIKLSN
jgi:hypothetical protein